MDESSMIQRLRVDADQIGTDDTDVDALIGSALRQGHRRRARRRVGAAITGAAVAAGLAVAVLAGGVTPALTGVPVPGPAGPPVSASGTPAPTETPTPSPISKASVRPTAPAVPTTTGRLSGTPAEVQTTLINLLPDPSAVTRAVSDSGSAELGREHNAYLDLQDAEGTSHILGGIGGGQYGDVCAQNVLCTQTSTRGGGTLWVTSSPAGDKAGPDQSIFYNRPDGGHIWLTQTAYANGSGPVTRPRLPLAPAQAKALITSSRWDDLFRG